MFYSLQGEGGLAGTAAGFVRLAGCENRCGYCDTPYAQDASSGQVMTRDQIAERIDGYGCRYAVVTGGEPMLAEGVCELVDELGRGGRHVTVETSGCEYRSVRCGLVSISPKLSNAGNATVGQDAAGRIHFETLQHYIYYHEYQFKFVVRERADVGEVETVLAGLRGVDRKKVYLMPQARTREEYRQYAPAVAELCVESGFRFSPRLHLELWDNQRGK